MIAVCVAPGCHKEQKDGNSKQNKVCRFDFLSGRIGSLIVHGTYGRNICHSFLHNEEVFYENIPILL